ncbi:bromodomain adjacent to zinc finger domain protein 2B-like [Centruroides sculpturatus]|uniref:bromodomain adjacent to zinc finger domain protein 2B-like n=1 Tax=Centruroides sculpturatus TaxID=218467 RepID=UPI000C6D1E36|nr:bromodomain adjacent to zinc finger domain protein 2B-like [Centruroides sculpturatus]
MQKRREMLLMVDLERERRRQHMLLVRALEARKKQEERERKREEILYEKRLNKEKKLEQRRLELQMIREMKKPIEDMCLKDNIPLPTLNRIPGVKLAGKAFADIMMVFEFLHNFGETLGFDMENLPTLNTLQMALLNHSEKTEEELLSVIHHLLVCVISDPGVPHCPEVANCLNLPQRNMVYFSWNKQFYKQEVGVPIESPSGSTYRFMNLSVKEHFNETGHQMDRSTRNKKLGEYS